MLLEGPPPRVLAHRGLALDAPENTLAAFRAALATGIRIVETDVHLSADGIAMVAHDPDLRRVAGLDRKVSDLTAAELAGLDLGGGHGMPMLAEALAEFPDARFNIDLKAEDVLAPAVAAIRTAGASDRVLLTSFDEGRRVRAAQALPCVATSPGSLGVLRVLVATWVRSGRSVRRMLRGAVALQVPESVRGLRIVTPRFVRRVHEAGAEVHVWTVNEPADMHRLLDLGVDGIVTDRADLAVAVLRERSPG
ncbi:glycerophosphoryl diester phosphodiesterase [Agromyces rhizosphaerae]|uniref:Glycerophosphoryl diester phosphodiesterase n=1 Tax=Agromyces rhizosphaerae TaxID=88374 RepID=A0A9W6D144_9MICO|nr:glycerophosphodiester phosphodiesterase [Agromyces rhizosphaerae]GLI28929.1 glycerophosphoryl diester phosphodiesterase [Agromyces rhizosphaerae]